MTKRWIGLTLTLALWPGGVAAQDKGPLASATPSPVPVPVRVGATIFSDFTSSGAPATKDADGNSMRSNAFDVSRAYITLSGGLTARVSFRVTADLRRLTGPSGSATSLDGSQAYRLKYAYGQIGLDGVLPKGSWVRIGAQQTPLIDYQEALYKYRFQGTQMVEREGFLSSSDFGISLRVNVPKDFGEVHAGVYNGESYAKAEANDQKSFQVRGTLRPLPRHHSLKGLRLTAFYNADHYLRDAPRKRLVLSGSFEHKYLVVGADLVRAADQVHARAERIDSQAYSVWARPRTRFGLEGLLRHDRSQPDEKATGRRQRSIAGIAYWFKAQAPVSVAVLIDYERVTHSGSLTKPRESRLALHTLFAF